MPVSARDRAELQRIASRDRPRRGAPAADGEGGGITFNRRTAIIIGIVVMALVVAFLIIRSISNARKQVRPAPASAAASDSGATAPPMVDVSVTSDGGGGDGSGSSATGQPIAPSRGTITPAGPPLPIYRVPQPPPPAPAPQPIVHQVQPGDTSLDAIAARLGKAKTQLHIYTSPPPAPAPAPYGQRVATDIRSGHGPYRGSYGQRIMQDIRSGHRPPYGVRQAADVRSGAAPAPVPHPLVTPNYQRAVLE